MYLSNEVHNKKGKLMEIWNIWYNWACLLRKSCSRERTFMWLLTVLAAFAIREDMMGGDQLCALSWAD